MECQSTYWMYASWGRSSLDLIPFETHLSLAQLRMPVRPGGLFGREGSRVDLTRLESGNPRGWMECKYPAMAFALR